MISRLPRHVRVIGYGVWGKMSANTCLRTTSTWPITVTHPRVLPQHVGRVGINASGDPQFCLRSDREDRRSLRLASPVDTNFCLSLVLNWVNWVDWYVGSLCSALPRASHTVRSSNIICHHTSQIWFAQRVHAHLQYQRGRPGVNRIPAQYGCPLIRLDSDLQRLFTRNFTVAELED